LGRSVVGTAAADAPPTSEKVKPAAPRTGTDFATLVRFEVCFTRAIRAFLHVRYLLESRTKTVRSATAPCKTGRARGHAATNHISEIHVHELMFINVSRPCASITDVFRFQTTSATAARARSAPHRSWKRFINCIEARDRQSVCSLWSGPELEARTRTEKPTWSSIPADLHGTS
jgi:hypothetical protein